MNNVLKREAIESEQTVMNYCYDVDSGRIKAGKKAIWGIRRFLKDLDNPNYWVDWKGLAEFQRWSRMFKHTKGVLAGKPISLEPFALYFVTNILFFKMKGSEQRRYRESYIQIARKNAKTQLLVLIATYVAFLSPEMEEIPITGYTKEQSDILFNEMATLLPRVAMLNKSPKKYSHANGKITVVNNGSVIRPLSREARRYGEGTSPSFAIVEEYHTHPNDEIVEVQRTGVMARPNSMIAFITTAGLNLSSPCYSFYQYCSRIVNPDDDMENDDIFVGIYELDEGDDINDESNWVKANPLLTSYEAGLESLRSIFKLAQDQPDKMRSFLTKNMNLWVDATEDGYMELKRWNACEVIKEETEEFKQGSSLYVGLDLSSTTDLTSVGMVYVKNGKYLVEQHSYVPEEKFAERMARDRVRYDMFVQQGLMTKTPGTVVDYNYLKEHVLETARVQGIVEVCYDKWNATHLAQDMQNEGLNMVEIPQSISQLSEPTKRFREAVYEGKIMHNGDQLLRWSMSNAVVRKDPQENIMVSKKESRDRIDPVAAILNAFSRARYDDLSIDLNEYIASDDFSF